MLSKSILNDLTSEAEFSGGAKKVLSLCFLAFAAALSFLSYTGTTLYFWPRTVSIQPELMSGAFAPALITPLYARGILRWSASIYGIVSFVLFLSIFSSIINLALEGAGKLPLYLISAAIGLSWLGMRPIASVVWVLVFVAAVHSAITISNAMGFTGFIFIASAFLGLVLHSNTSPAGVFNQVLGEYSKRELPVSQTVAVADRVSCPTSSLN